jgi:hypothetical protein
MVKGPSYGTCCHNRDVLTSDVAGSSRFRFTIQCPTRPVIGGRATVHSPCLQRLVAT